MDRFENRALSDTGPAVLGFGIIASDTNDLQEITRAIYVGAGGDLVVEMAWGGEVTLRAVPGGTLLPLRVRKVLAATTASYLVGLC